MQEIITHYKRYDLTEKKRSKKRIDRKRIDNTGF